jgi:hypothetical protein
MSNDDRARRVAILKVVSEVTASAYKEAREELAPHMTRGSRLVARSPLDSNTKIGAVTLTDPKAVATISDRKKFEAWVGEHYADQIERDYEIAGSHQEVAAILFENAPHLLRAITKVDPELEKQIRTDSAKLGIPIGPNGEADVEGVTVFIPDAHVTCKPDDNALATVVDLFRSKQFTLESLTFPEIPGGAA